MMNKKTYTAPHAEILSDTFEDVIVASGSPETSTDNVLALKTDLFDK